MKATTLKAAISIWRCLSVDCEHLLLLPTTSIASNCNGTSPVTVRMSRWNTRQMNSAELCQFDRLVASRGKLWQVATKPWQVLASCGKFWQCLPDSTEVCQEDCVRAHASTTKNLDYLIMRFSRCFFLFLTQRLILYKSYCRYTCFNQRARISLYCDTYAVLVVGWFLLIV